MFQSKFSYLQRMNRKICQSSSLSHVLQCHLKRLAHSPSQSIIRFYNSQAILLLIIKTLVLKIFRLLSFGTVKVRSLLTTKKGNIQILRRNSDVSGTSLLSIKIFSPIKLLSMKNVIPLFLPTINLSSYHSFHSSPKRIRRVRNLALI